MRRQFKRCGPLTALANTLPGVTIECPPDTTTTRGDERPLWIATATKQYLITPIVASVEMVAFWTAIALPFLYVPLLLTRLETWGEVVVFIGLFVLNVVALVAGHRYKTESDTDRRRAT